MPPALCLYDEAHFEDCKRHAQLHTLAPEISASNAGVCALTADTQSFQASGMFDGTVETHVSGWIWSFSLFRSLNASSLPCSSPT
jgi:hypothetical protein